ncbi:putative laccase-9 [Cornus florida]|uniref:putative laccase-9 n=1 Tax=Cornus florida TaxID=4283 RepID=UPI0028985F16|nr:putative laccase-9 [Cornus florida]
MALYEVLRFVFLGVAYFFMAQAHVHYYDFVLREANFTRLCSTKSMLVVNDSFPGPVIRVYRGDTVYVNVHNQGYYGVTMHWHGVLQPRNPWSDGPEYITQCPIQPGANFTYEVILSTEEGTLWWHAHSDWTRNSVHGAIVIHPPAGISYPFPTPDEEEIVILGSWYEGDLYEEVLEDLQTGVGMPESDAHLINGQPGDFCDCSNGTTYRRVIDYGKTYLLRIVNAGMNADIFFAIAEHNIAVVGMDGNYLKPIATPYIVISPGQTMDVLLTANQSLGHYYMATRTYFTGYRNFDYYDKTNATAILEYRGNYTPPAYPTYPVDLPSYHDIISATKFLFLLRSLASHDHPVDVPQNITASMFIAVSMNTGLVANTSYEDKLASSLNNVSFANPNIDVLHAYYWNMSGVYSTDFPDQPPTHFNFTSDETSELTVLGTKVKMLNYNEAVEITFQGTDIMNASESHPMHLHGHDYYVVGSGVGNFDPEVDPKGYNLVDPPRVNTFAVPKVGWMTIRFVANNPGVWLWHCHFSRHLTWGMSTVFIVKNGGTPETSIRDPPLNLPQCEVSFIDGLQEFYHSDGGEPYE